MQQLCPFISPCPEPYPPYTNLSATAPDQDLFFGTYYSNPQTPPRLGSTWQSWGCIGECTSATSQADADQCAANQSIECTVAGGPPLGRSPIQGAPPLNNGVAPPAPYQTFGSDQTSCQVSCPDGTLSTYTLFAGYAVALSKAQANAIAQSACLRFASLNRVCLGSFSGFSCSGSFYSAIIPATGADAPFTFQVVGGVLPDGLLLSPDGVLSGIPATPGNYSFTVQCTNSHGVSVSKAMSFEVLGITNSPVLPDGTVGTPYSEQLVSGSGADTFSITGGSLPTGLTMDDGGLISGTPTVAGPTTFEVTVTDTFLNQCKQDFVISVAMPAPSLDWSMLVWDQYVLLANPPGVITGSGVGATFTVDGTGPGAGMGSVAISPVHASLVYTGPTVNCLLTINQTVYSPGTNIGINVVQDGVPVLQIVILAAGVNVFPFTIAAGVASLIEVEDGIFPASLWVVIGNTDSDAFTGTFSNVP